MITYTKIKNHQEQPYLFRCHCEHNKVCFYTFDQDQCNYAVKTTLSYFCIIVFVLLYLYFLFLNNMLGKISSIFLLITTAMLLKL